MAEKNITAYTFAKALKTMLPIVPGAFPTAVAYALVARNAGMLPQEVVLSSLFVFAGSVQFISIELMRQGIGYVSFALTVFLLHARHMFFGVSVFDKFNKAPKAKPFLIFSLTDESYAIMTSGETPDNVNEGLYYIFIPVIMYVTWNTGTLLGVLASEFITFNTAGMDFALTAMFIVIVVEQLKSYRSKLPFIIGGLSAAAALVVLGPQSMLLGCCAMSVVLIVALRKHIDTDMETEGAA